MEALPNLLGLTMRKLQDWGTAYLGTSGGLELQAPPRSKATHPGRKVDSKIADQQRPPIRETNGHL